MKYAPYSFSKLNTYLQCPRKFKAQYVDKLKPEEADLTALLKGSAVHSMLEHYPEKGNHVLSDKYASIVKNFSESDIGKKYLTTQSIKEQSFGLSEDFEPLSYKDKTAMFRGKIDYIGVVDVTVEEIIEVQTLDDVPDGYEIVEVL